MINWFPEGGAFLTKGEADRILSFLKERGLVGKHDIHADGDGWYEEDVRVSFEDSTVTDKEAQEYWMEVSAEAAYMNNSWEYPPSRTTTINAKQGSRRAIDEIKAGEMVRDSIKEFADDVLYELNEGYEISDWAMILIKADGYEETGRDDNTENYTKWRAMEWEIEVDLNGIRRIDRDD